MSRHGHGSGAEGGIISRTQLQPDTQHAAKQSVPIYLLWPAQRFEPPRLRAYIDYMVEQFTPAPPWARRKRGKA